MLDILWQRYGKRCEILTGIPKPRRGILYAREDKLNWVKDVLSADIIVNIVFREQKKEYCAGPDCVLIDDSMSNVKAWEKAGGTGILFVDVKTTLLQLDDIEAR